MWFLKNNLILSNMYRLVCSLFIHFKLWLFLSVFRIRSILMRIRFRKSWSDSRSDLKSNKFHFFFFLNFFSVKGIKLITMCFFVVIYEVIIHIYIKQNKWFLFLKNYILIILVDLYASLLRFFLHPGSRTFPEVDPDPTKWYGSEAIYNYNVL